MSEATVPGQFVPLQQGGQCDCLAYACARSASVEPIVRSDGPRTVGSIAAGRAVRLSRLYVCSLGECGTNCPKRWSPDNWFHCSRAGGASVLRVCLFARRVRNQLSEGMVPGQERNQVDFMAADYMKPSISKQAAHPSIAFASLRHEGPSPAVSGRCECRADCRQRLDGHGGSSRVYCGARDTRALSTSSETRIKDTAF